MAALAVPVNLRYPPLSLGTTLTCNSPRRREHYILETCHVEFDRACTFTSSGSQEVALAAYNTKLQSPPTNYVQPNSAQGHMHPAEPMELREMIHASLSVTFSVIFVLFLQQATAEQKSASLWLAAADLSTTCCAGPENLAGALLRRIIRRMCGDTTLLEKYESEVQDLDQKFQLNQMMAEKWKQDCFRPLAHAEVNLHNWLEHTEGGTRPERFFRGYQFIGSSKPRVRRDQEPHLRGLVSHDEPEAG
ncbi:uncharacterized protein MKZ38_004258 [Zalerion maritima]|uniref:Uncharacterized protein n=1 Tax=Zalerion maritima TaxID=339359 RepID=A0AAD5WV25_9PEZI|nr:uncharacterized protein MKZ38_004258 [Zalerion maritima]